MNLPDMPEYLAGQQVREYEETGFPSPVALT